MRWASERRRHPRFDIALRRIQLGLDEKDTLGEVGSSQVGVSEISPGKIGHSQVGPSQISSNEVCPSQIGSSQIGSFEFGPDEVCSSVVLLLVPDCSSHEFARVHQQSIDGSSVCCHVQFYESIGTVVSEAFGLLERETEFTVKRAGRLQRQCFG